MGWMDSAGQGRGDGVGVSIGDWRSRSFGGWTFCHKIEGQADELVYFSVD